MAGRRRRRPWGGRLLILVALLCLYFRSVAAGTAKAAQQRRVKQSTHRRRPLRQSRHGLLRENRHGESERTRKVTNARGSGSDSSDDDVKTSTTTTSNPADLLENMRNSQDHVNELNTLDMHPSHLHREKQKKGKENGDQDTRESKHRDKRPSPKSSRKGRDYYERSAREISDKKSGSNREKRSNKKAPRSQPSKGSRPRRNGDATSSSSRFPSVLGFLRAIVEAEEQRVAYAVDSAVKRERNRLKAQLAPRIKRATDSRRKAKTSRKRMKQRVVESRKRIQGLRRAVKKARNPPNRNNKVPKRKGKKTPNIPQTFQQEEPILTNSSKSTTKNDDDGASPQTGNCTCPIQVSTSPLATPVTFNIRLSQQPHITSTGCRSNSERPERVWQRRGWITDGPTGDQFGYHVSLSASTGSRLAISSPGSAFMSGKVRVYALADASRSVWYQLGQDLQGSPDSIRFGGRAVQLSQDGTTLLVSSDGPRSDTTRQTLLGAGQVDVFRWTGLSWLNTGSVRAENRAPILSATMSADGNTLAIAYAPRENHGGGVSNTATLVSSFFRSKQMSFALHTGEDTLRAASSLPYVDLYRYDALVSQAWIKVHTIVGTRSTCFGATLALDQSGSTLAVALPCDTTSGSVNLYNVPSVSSSLLNPIGMFTQQQQQEQQPMQRGSASRFTSPTQAGQSLSSPKAQATGERNVASISMGKTQPIFGSRMQFTNDGRRLAIGDRDNVHLYVSTGSDKFKFQSVITLVDIMSTQFALSQDGAYAFVQLQSSSSYHLVPLTAAYDVALRALESVVQTQEVSASLLETLVRVNVQVAEVGSFCIRGTGNPYPIGHGIDIANTGRVAIAATNPRLFCPRRHSATATTCDHGEVVILDANVASNLPFGLEATSSTSGIRNIGIPRRLRYQSSLSMAASRSGGSARFTGSSSTTWRSSTRASPVSFPKAPTNDAFGYPFQTRSRTFKSPFTIVPSSPAPTETAADTIERSANQVTRECPDISTFL